MRRISTLESAAGCPRVLADLPGSLHAVPRSSLEAIARAAASLAVHPAGQFADVGTRRVEAAGLDRLQAALLASVERLGPLPVERSYGKRLADRHGVPPPLKVLPGSKRQ